MIETLIQSTKAYLDLLERTQGGRQHHDVNQIQLLPNELIYNQTWPVISCVLEPKLKIPSDVGVTLVPTGHPEREIPAQILKYDRMSGCAKIAVAENLPAKTGQLVIDFTWLIRRLLMWLEKHGGNVSNPFVPAGDVPAIPEFSAVGAMSDEQIASVKNLLGSSVAYVWGPPGTGKTRHVLAETVAHLIRHGKKVLVTAATNLAVDNALDAILHTPGVEIEGI